MEIKGIMKEIQQNLERRKEIRRAVATCYVKEALLRKNAGEKWAQSRMASLNHILRDGRFNGIWKISIWIIIYPDRKL